MKLFIVLAVSASLAAAHPFTTRQADKKAPFLEPDTVFETCGKPKAAGDQTDQSELCVGTVKYCREGLYKLFDEPFKTEQECLDSREKAPAAGAPTEDKPETPETPETPTDSAPKPFLQPNDSFETCGSERTAGDIRFESEACVGTAVFCNKGFYEKFDEKFANEQECLSSRDKAPAAGAPTEDKPETPTDETATPPTDESPADGSAIPPTAPEVPPAGDEDLPACEE